MGSDRGVEFSGIQPSPYSYLCCALDHWQSASRSGDDHTASARQSACQLADVDDVWVWSSGLSVSCFSDGSGSNFYWGDFSQFCSGIWRPHSGLQVFLAPES